MKNWSRRVMCLLLAMLTMVSLLSLAAAEENTVNYTAEKWIANTNDQYSLKLNEDGTGVYIADGKSFAGEWTLETGGKDAYCRDGLNFGSKPTGMRINFTYDQYGKRTAFWSVCKVYNEDLDLGETILHDGSHAYFRESTLAAELKEAEERTYALKWKEKIDLDFVSFSINDAKICRVLEEAYDTGRNYPYTVNKGKQYIVLTGSIENKANETIELDDIYAEAMIDGKTYKAKVSAIYASDYYPEQIIRQNTSTQLLMYVEVPEKVAKTFKTARFRFSFRNDLLNTGSSKTYSFANGEFCFQLTISNAKAKAMQKAAGRKKTYFSVGKNKSLPQPSSYTDLAWTGYLSEGRGKLTIPIYKKTITYGCAYGFRAKYSDGKIADLCNAYINGLKKDGFKVKQVKQADVYSYWGGGKYYSIFKGNTMLGWIELHTGNKRMYVVVVS